MKINARTTPAALALALCLPLAACGSEDVPSAGGASDGYPLAVTNCGHEVRLEKAPERIVTIKSTSTELALALGLGDKVVGQAFPDGPVWHEWAEEAAEIPVLGEKAPSQEVVLETEPDLVFAGWESNLAADTAGERDVLAKLGVASYVSPAACQGAGAPGKMTYELLFEQILEAGRVLGAPQEAEELVAAQRKELASLGRFARGTTALWWSSGVDTPFVGGAAGAPQMVMDAVGLTNVAGNVDDTWTSLGWEAIVDADPDVIVLVDADWNTAASKIKHLESHPATARMTAVKEKRYLTVPFPAGEAGVRSVRAAADLVEAGASTHGLAQEQR